MCTWILECFWHKNLKEIWKTDFNNNLILQIKRPFCTRALQNVAFLHVLFLTISLYLGSSLGTVPTQVRVGPSTQAPCWIPLKFRRSHPQTKICMRVFGGRAILCSRTLSRHPRHSRFIDNSIMDDSRIDMTALTQGLWETFKLIENHHLENHQKTSKFIDPLVISRSSQEKTSKANVLQKHSNKQSSKY